MSNNEFVFSRDHSFDKHTKRTSAAKKNVDLLQESLAFKGQRGVRDSGNYKADFSKMLPTARQAICESRLTKIN